MNRILITALSMVVFNLAGPAASAKTSLEAITESQKQAMLEVMPDPEKVDRIESLPIEEMKVMKGEDGNLFYISSSARYSFLGQVYDNWTGQFIDTLDDVYKSANKIILDEMDVDIEDFNPLTMGEGDKEVVLFVDPLCDSCTELLKSAQELKSSYTFKVLNIPAFGEESNRLAKQLNCSKDDNETKLQALISKKIDTLSQADNCTNSVYQQTLVFATFLNIKGVPLIISPDGSLGKGVPSNLQEWLQERE